MRSGARTRRGGDAGIGSSAKRILFSSLLLYYAIVKVPRLNLSTRTTYTYVKEKQNDIVVSPSVRSKGHVSFILPRPPTTNTYKANTLSKQNDKNNNTATQMFANKQSDERRPLHRPKRIDRANLQFSSARASAIQTANNNNNKAHKRPPKLVWLMTFPSSGTTYTLALMEQLSNYSMATNYMVDAVLPKPKFPVYKEHPEGPFWRGPSVRPLPDTFVLVKTHCDGYRGNGTESYTMSVETFVRACGRTERQSRTTMRRAYYDYYHVKMATRIVRIVRNPFHNLIAYFHHTKGRGLYENNRQGFRSYCKDKDANFRNKFRDLNFTKAISNLVERTICHDSVMNYIMWHNHAFEVTPILQLPTLLLHYEDYEDKFDETVSNLLDFLELPRQGEPLAFSARHDYEDYYTQEDRANIKALAKQLASQKTWEAIQRYFD